MNSTLEIIEFLVIGSAGMAGHMIYTYLKEQGKSVYGIDLRANGFSVDEVFDTSNFPKLERLLLRLRCPNVINAAAILGEEMVKNPKLAKHIDSDMPHCLARAVETYGGHLFHISTDFVFSGDRGDYLELDVPDNDTLYGQLKRAGESPSSYVTNLRLSIIGPTPLRIIPNYLNNVIETNEERLWGYVNANWTGITTLELSKALLELSTLQTTPPNVVHLCSETKMSRWLSIREIELAFGVDKPIEEITGAIKDYSLRSTLVPYRQPLSTQLLNLRRWMEAHKGLYSHYACINK